MLTRPESQGQGQEPQGQGQKPQARPRLRPEIKAKVELNSYGAMAVPMTLVYQCTVSVIIQWYTVFWRILVTLTLALALNEPQRGQGQGQKHKAQAKARSLKAKAKA